MMMWASRTHARRPVRLSALAFLSLLCAGALVGTAAGAHGEGHWDADAVADTTAPLVVSIDFDPPNGVRRADPAMYTSFDAYVVLDGANPGNLPGGLRTLTLRLGVTDGTSSAPQFESLLPGKLVMGGWREGIMMASAPCSAEEHIVIGVMHLFYLGKPGVVSVLDHPDFPRWIVDCEDEECGHIPECIDEDCGNGLDDDGDAGSAWFYPGQVTGGTYGFDFGACVEAFDINPSIESGSDNPGVSTSARAFDFDFDGRLDVMLGWNDQSAWAAPSETILLLGNGDGTFAAPVVIRDFPNSTYGSAFATPQRLCARFSISGN